MMVIKQELHGSRDQEVVQVDGSPDGAQPQEVVQEHIQVDESPEGTQQLCSPVQLEQGDHPSAAQLLPTAQETQGRNDIHVHPQSQPVQGGMAPNTGAQPADPGWELPKVIVKVQPQNMSQGWDSPEVTVQVQPQRPRLRWEAPSVTVQVQLQQGGPGPSLPQVNVQLQPQEQGQGSAGIKVTVQLQLGCDPEEMTYFQNQGEGVLDNGEHWTPQKNQGERRSEGERELAVVKLVPQGVLSQKQDQGGKVEKAQPDQSQEERTEVVELHDMQAGARADLKGMVTEEQLQHQNQEQEQLKADLSLQKEDQRSTEMRQKQGNIQENPREIEEDQKEYLGQELPKKRPRQAPNYFVAIPITDDKILDRIEDVQELIVSKEPDLSRALLPVQTMHLTIIVAHLGTEEVKKAVLALKQSKAKVEDILQGKDLNLTFHGIGEFNNQVLYVKMLEEDQKMLNRIAAVEECFIEMNLDISGSKDFKPHLTFLKLSKASRLRRRGFRKICTDLYKEYEDSHFGTEAVSRIDLCAMRKKKQESGYYYCECSINVGSRDTEESKEQEMQTEDVGETSSEDLTNNVVKAEIGATAASCKLASAVVADDKPSEIVAEASIAIKEKEINEAKGQPEATDGTFPTAGDICSKSVLGLLPASSDVLKSLEVEQEKAKIADGSLQKTEATEYAPGQTSLG
ncbi:zinc finger protein 853-like isoform X2 [Cyanistes caeruleus]|uniref:zinc finger protein 853-like isoform X2 n=1 Tax=Cyanistes caeruleus TaxID=156563 RepID=UPI000CDA8C3B|nr:zinc finger protein 853-like isoform X2 [Cyanistes caeruleus]